MRRPIIAGNWKMHKTVQESVEALKKLAELADNDDVDVLIFPGYLAVKSASELDNGIKIGVQDMFYEEEGAFTAEVSPLMVKEVCETVLIGHSERRQFFGETDENVNKKVKTALAHDLKPVVCVGESLEDRENGRTEEVLEMQIKKGLDSLEKIDDITIAYEPVWAIGTGKTATKEQAQEVHRFIRSLIGEIFGKDPSEKIRILYGGSVKPENIKELMSMDDIDGALVGGASLDPETFSKIVNYNQ